MYNIWGQKWTDLDSVKDEGQQNLGSWGIGGANCCNGKISMGLSVGRMLGSILNLRYHLESKEKYDVDD